jgi:KipI family sensor histidine kinase inhibitor
MNSLVPLGDRAWLATFASETQAYNWHEAVDALYLKAVIDLVLAYRSVSVHFDPDRIDSRHLEQILKTVVSQTQTRIPGRLHEIPVWYNGIDLADVCKQANLTSDDLIKIHSQTSYDVFAIGFQPGFPYAGYLPEPLKSIARRKAPRLRVPAGSVAIAAGQTGIYPSELPGGWNLIGQTPLSIVDLESSRFPIKAGDQLRFVPIDQQEYEARYGEPLA